MTKMRVSGEYLFRKLYQIGIRGKMLRVIKDMQTGNRASVLVDNCLTHEFELNSVVLKGSELGPLLFLVFINDLLTDLQKSSLGAKIGDLTISCLGFADDLVLTAESPENLQLLINKCECWVKKNLMTFNTDKCKVMVFNRPSSNLNFSIYGKQLSMVNSYKYLGIVISNTNQTNLYTDHFKKTIEKAEKRLHCIAHFGFHRDGLRPKTAIKLYKLMVRPILEYGSQVLTYRKYFLKSSTDKLKDLYKHTVFGKKLEHLQTKA